MCSLITLGDKEICLLDDVRLIGSEILALPTISTFERSRTSGQQVMNSVILENSSVIVHGLGAIAGRKLEKIAILFSKTCFKVEVKSPTLS